MASAGHGGSVDRREVNIELPQANLASAVASPAVVVGDATDERLVELLSSREAGHEQTRDVIAVELTYRLRRRQERAELHAETTRELLRQMDAMLRAVQTAMASADSTLIGGRMLLKNRTKEQNVGSRLTDALREASRVMEHARSSLGESVRMRQEIESNHATYTSQAFWSSKRA